MSLWERAVTCIGTLFLVVLPATPSLAQTLFTTEDFRADREHWTDPAYYRHNTARELTDMQVDTRYGEEGSGRDDYEIRSPYPFATAEQHYQAWLDEANGGTSHTLETLPDWDGLWGGGGSWLGSRNIQASTIAGALTPQYQEYYVEQVKAEAEGRHWWAASFCLPDGFIRGLERTQEFVVRPNQVVVISDMLSSIQVRWIYTDGRGHAPADFQFPQWMGESIAFWDGDALVVYTNQIRQWNATHSMFEWSGQLEAVERYERVGDTIMAEVTLYDPIAFVEPLHAEMTYRLQTNPNIRPVFSTCTDTNGPASNIFVNEEGFLDERTPGSSGYWDPTDPRPWAAYYAIGEN
jgi:hypothetical protein